MMPKYMNALQGIAKYDLDSPRGSKEAAVATIEYKGMRGGEAYFVPRYYGHSKEDADKCDGE